MEGLRPPTELSFLGNVAENWRRFKQRLQVFMTACEPLQGSEKGPKPPGRSEAQKVALLLHVAGEEAQEVYETFNLPDDVTFETVIQKFEKYCIPKKNETYERYKFRMRMQEEGETFEAFYRDLSIKVKSCEFATLADSMLRDQVVYGTSDKKLRQRLLRQSDLTLDKAVDMCRASEVERLRTSAWEAKEQEIDQVQMRRGQTRANRTDQFAGHRCGRCNFIHRSGTCPAFGKTCRRCHKANHFASCCRAVVNKVDNVLGHEQDYMEDEFTILEIGSCKSKGPDWMISAQVAGRHITFKVDTGAQANLLPLSWVRRNAPKAKITHTDAKLRSYSGGVIAHCGVTTLEMICHDSTKTVRFFIVKKARTPILGLLASEQFGLIRRVANVSLEAEIARTGVKEFSGAFQGLGCVSRSYKMELQPGTVPVVQPARRIPHALRRPVQEELERLVKAGILKKADGPTDWVSPIVIARKKSGQLRLCLDPRSINKYLKREHYQLPKREDIQAELAGARFFSTLDANSGFHQIPLDESTAKICTMGTPFGRYHYLRLPFGIASAPEVFQKTMTDIFEGLAGVRVYIDDILVWGRTRKEHDERLRSVLKRAEQQHLTFNLGKCKFAKEEVEYLGDVISSNGIRPSSRLIESVLRFPPPRDKKDLHRFLGLINYFGKYIPDLASKTQLLRTLLRDEYIFEWSAAAEQEWSCLKVTLTSAPLLAIFDITKPTKVATDASKGALGAALFQRHEDCWRPVAYASRVLSQSETRYSQIEKETLGIVFGLERFHDFTYGRSIMVETDHRPLLAISKKAIGDMPPRLQRFFLRLMQYDFHLQFVPGKSLVVPDTLSRIYEVDCGPTETTSADTEIHAIAIRQSLVSEATALRIRRETERDPTLQAVIDQLQHHQPVLGEFKAVEGELTVIDGLLFKATKVVIPRSMRTEILERIHDGHLGINKCLSRARQLVFWPGITGDITTFIKRCSVCRELSYQQAEEPLLMRETPSRPWQRIGVDLFYYAGTSFLVAYDAYSNYPEVEQLSDTSAHSVIEKMKSMFARHGIPLELCSDNGPQFHSREFAQFARRYDFTHTTSSPRFPSSNGLAEKGVQVVKRILKKSRRNREDFWLGLLAYRATPVEDGRCPSELLMGRRLRSRIPDFTQDVPPPVWKRQQRNRGRTALQGLQEGDMVRVRDTKGWMGKAKVKSSVAPRSYRVVTEKQQVLRRNRRHLLKTSETCEPNEQGPDWDEDSEGEDTDVSASPPTRQLSSPPPEQASFAAPVEPAGQELPSQRPVRQRRPPARLRYDENFHQQS